MFELHHRDPTNPNIWSSKFNMLPEAAPALEPGGSHDETRVCHGSESFQKPRAEMRTDCGTSIGAVGTSAVQELLKGVWGFA
jgi:hypothetical protein